MKGSNDNPPTPRFRLAPTPSGLLHQGNAASFILTWVLTRCTNGSLFLRIDDLDRERFRMEYLDDIFRTIDWLGIDYDIGPAGPDDFLQNWSQTLRQVYYNQLLTELQQSHRLFECTCSRTQLANGSPCSCREGITPRSTSNTIRFHTRDHELIRFNDLLKGDVQCDINLTMRNFVIRKKDGTASYQIASLSDDMQFGITHIVRGEDLIPSTAAQLALAGELNTSDFSMANFIHHPLITGDSGLKLSKSAGDVLIKENDWNSSRLPTVINVVGAWLGLEEPIGELDELRDASRETCLELLDPGRCQKKYN